MKSNLLYRVMILAATGIFALLLSGCGADKDKGGNTDSSPAFGTVSSEPESAGESGVSSDTASKNNTSSQSSVPSETDGDNSVMTDEEFEEFIKNNSSKTVSAGITVGNKKEDESEKPSSSSTPDKNGTSSSDPETENSSSSSGNLWDKDGDGYYDITIY